MTQQCYVMVPQLSMKFVRYIQQCLGNDYTLGQYSREKDKDTQEWELE